MVLILILSEWAAQQLPLIILPTNDTSKFRTPTVQRDPEEKADVPHSYGRTRS